MAHFLTLVVGDKVNEQLAIYDVNLPVEPYKVYDVPFGAVPDGVDETGPYLWCHVNDRGKWDWHITGGRWTGYLRLKHGASGELGKPGQKEDIVLPYGELSADVALHGDIDWRGMRSALWVKAVRQWTKFQVELENATHQVNFLRGIPQEQPYEQFLMERSHPATFAVVKNSDWYERGPIGWWGLILDADPVAEWHRKWDDLLSVPPDTLISIVDCHIGGP